MSCLTPPAYCIVSSELSTCIILVALLSVCLPVTTSGFISGTTSSCTSEYYFRLYFRALLQSEKGIAFTLRNKLSAEDRSLYMMSCTVRQLFIYTQILQNKGCTYHRRRKLVAIGGGGKTGLARPAARARKIKND